MDPLVSIIMPVYNAERYVGEAIRSVINQRYQNWELLIINDGSTDDSECVISSFDDKRIQYFIKENGGVSTARNLGLIYMKGDFFCFLDADDLLPVNSLSARLLCFEQNKEINYVDGAVLDINPAGEFLSSSFMPNFRGDPLPLLARMDERCFLGITWMIRRQKSINYRFDVKLKYCEDLDFYIQTVLQQKGEYAYTKENILYYRKLSMSAMTNLDGLADGYSCLLYKLRSQRFLNIKQEIYLRYRMTRIMFLSYFFLRRNPFKAIMVLSKYWL